MMKLTMFTLGDAIANFPNDKGVITSHLVSPRTVLRPAYIPGTFSFGLSAGVRGINLKEQNSIYFSIYSPTGKLIQKSQEAKVPSITQADNVPPEYQGFMLCLDIRNLEVKEEGVYLFSLIVNDEELERQEIPIFRGAPHV